MLLSHGHAVINTYPQVIISWSCIMHACVTVAVSKLFEPNIVLVFYMFHQIVLESRVA